MELPYSSDEDLAELTDKDQTTELIGYIDEICAAQEVGQQKKYKLFKFVVSNDSKKRVQCLIWGDELIQQHQPQITINRKIHIEGGYTKAVLNTYLKENQNLVPFEIIIQKSTVVEFTGYHLPNLKNATAERPNSVTFQSITKASGLIAIEGYIRTKFVQSSSRSENMSYGCGAITDGVHKITIHICNYVPIDIKKGVYVKVIGEIKNVGNEGLITISCKDSSCVIADVEHDVMSSEQVYYGGRMLKRKAPDN